MTSVGVEVEQDRLDSPIKALEGKKLHQVMEAGTSKLSTISGKFSIYFCFLCFIMHKYYIWAIVGGDGGGDIAEELQLH